MNIQAELRRRFSTVLSALVENPDSYLEMIRPTQDTRFGDYQANFAMPLAGKLKRKSVEIAHEVISRLDVSDLCEAPEIAGPGFINLRLRTDWLETQTNLIATDDREGVEPVSVAKKYVVDFSGPNVAKPMHVGHLRSTVIGDAICRILRFAGHEALGDNHIGDWGTQFGMIIYGYKHFLDRAAFEKDAVHELARLYRLVHRLSDYYELRALQPKLDQALAAKLQEIDDLASQPGDEKSKQKRQKKLKEELEDLREQIANGRKKQGAVEDNPELNQFAKAHPEIAVKARLETARLHAGDAENVTLWNQFVPACLAAIQGVYDRLGIRFDFALGESFYQPMLAEVVSDLQARGLARESEGAICVFIPGNEAPFIVRKSDGAFTYATTDLATIKYRQEQIGADGMLYVVDTRQGDHFKLLFETARLWGYQNIEFKHVNFGTVCGPDGKPYKTREGDIVGLESLLDEAVSEAYRVIESVESSKSTEESRLDENSMRLIAEVVGIGGIKYADLKHNRESDYEYSLQKMLAKNGDTATYMQYAYARVCGILRRGGVQRDELRKRTGQITLSHPKERMLALQLNQFSEVIHAAAVDCRPSLLTDYLFRTANTFSSFYDECPVLKAESEAITLSRLQLSDLTARVLERGLSLLGIQTIERM